MSDYSDGGAIRLPAWFDGHFHNTIDSTNEEVKRLAARGAPDGAFVVAWQQLAGRGRSGRDWSSPEGNLYSSLLLRTPSEPAAAGLISFCAALAVADTIAGFAPDLSIGHKWPNDVLLDGKKISGILLESASKPGGKLDWLAVGVGINLQHYPSDSRLPATSLVVEGVTLDKILFLESYTEYLSFWIDNYRAHGFQNIRRAWLDRAVNMGREIQVRLANETISGIFQDLDITGALMLRLADGSIRSITSGEVFFSGLDTTENKPCC